MSREVKLTVPSAYSNLRVITALRIIVSNLDKIKVEDLEAITNKGQLQDLTDDKFNEA